MGEVAKIHRHYAPPNSSGSEYIRGCGPEEAEDEIHALVDLRGDGDVKEWVIAKESDHTGIVAEWNTGTATTLIEAALVTETQALSSVDHLSATQRANLPGKAITWPAP